MSLLTDLLRLNVPVIVLVEQDLAWARMSVLDAAASLGSRRVLEYTAAEGWSGAEGLMHASGLPTIVSLKSSRTDPAPLLSQFSSWLRGLAGRDTEAEDSPFFEGVAVLHDLYVDLESSVLVRQMIELAPVLSYHAASAVVVIPAPLPAAHPLHSAAVQIACEPVGERRHHDLVQAFVSQMGPLAEGADVGLLARELTTLSVAAAEAVLRLVALQLYDARERGTAEIDVAVVVRRERERILA